MTGANPFRGEVEAVIDGVPRRLRLTLGGLAALERRIGAGGLVELAERFEQGRHGADDLIALLTLGLRGGGAEVDEAEVAEMNFENGAVGASRVAAALLGAAFGGGA